MLVQTFPKPKVKKHKVKYNHVPTIHDRCRYTGQPYAETHEVFYGNGKRQLSIKYGMQVKVSNDIHSDIHRYPLKGLDLDLKKEFQGIFESKYGHSKFMQLFGRNYLNIDSSASSLGAQKDV
jgi:hypothetical protein